MEMNGTITIRRPVEEVFEYVINTANDANWRTGVSKSALESKQKMGEGALGYTLAGKKRADWKVVSYAENKRVDWVLTSGPILGTGGYLLNPVEEGTEFTLLADVKPSGFLRLLGPLFGWIGRRQNQKDVKTLKDILESDS